MERNCNNDKLINIKMILINVNKWSCNLVFLDLFEFL